MRRSKDTPRRREARKAARLAPVVVLCGAVARLIGPAPIAYAIGALGLLVGLVAVVMVIRAYRHPDVPDDPSE